MPKVIPFVFFLSRLSISNRIWILSCPKFDPSPFLPIRFHIKVDTKLSRLSIKINFVIEGISDFFIVSTQSIANFDSTYTNTILKHLSSDLYLVSMLILINLKNCELSLSYEKYYCNFTLIASQSYTNVSIIDVEEKLSFFVHLEEEKTVLDKEFLLI